MTTYRNESDVPMVGGDALGAPHAGDTTRRLYDDATGLVTNKLYADGKGPSYDYSPDGKLSRRVWARGIATTFAYDAYGANTNETVVGVAGTNTIERFYDDYGRDTGYALNGVRQTILAYDEHTGRLSTMSVPAREDEPHHSTTTTSNYNSFAWTCLPNSDLKSSLTYPKGLTASWTYDANNQLLQVRNASPTNVISQFDYTYDAAGRRATCARSGDAMSVADTIAYAYNIRGELTNAVSNVDANYAYSYDFDPIGNRVSSCERGTNTTYAANELNQYTQIDEGNSAISAPPRETFNPEFDADGNQTLVKTATGIWRVTYNGENRPILWVCLAAFGPIATNGETIAMSYDRMGRRVTKNAQRFFYDGYLQVYNSHSPTPTLNSNSYIWDPTEPIATRPLVWLRADSAAYYVHDGNKNVSEVISSSGDLAAHYEYAPFGAGIAQRGTFAATNPWRFSSEFADDELGCDYYNYREYEPVTGRWLSRDPIAFLKNLYCYCNNFCLIDWLGLFTFDDFKGKPPEDASHGACTYWDLTGNPGRKETALVGEYTGDVCKEAIQGNGKKKKVCPCLKCYRYKARYPDFSFSVSLNGEKSWVKDIARNDADLLKHEQVHLKIVEKEAEKEENRIKNTWIEGELNCDAKWAEYNAKVSLANAFRSLYDGAYDNIMDKQNKYDRETEHGTIHDKQDEWNKKYE